MNLRDPFLLYDVSSRVSQRQRCLEANGRTWGWGTCADAPRRPAGAPRARLRLHLHALYVVLHFLNTYIGLFHVSSSPYPPKSIIKPDR